MPTTNHAKLKVGASRRPGVADRGARGSAQSVPDKDWPRKPPPPTRAEIVALRELTGVSQALFADYLNLVTERVRLRESGTRRPRGSAPKALNLVKIERLARVR